jgi:adenylate cyclase
MTFRRKPFFYIPLVCGLLGLAIFIRYLDPFFVRALRLIAFDSYQRLAPEGPGPAVPVRVVDIDEKSLAIVGQWPWSRTMVSELLQAIAADGPLAIGFDILFAEPDRTSLGEIAKHLPPEQAGLLASAVAATPSNDATLAAALKASPSVLATTLVDREGGVFEAKAGFAIAGDDPRPFITNFKGVRGNLADLETAAKGIGAINWIPDRDQVVRRAALVYRVGDQFVPTLAAEALRIAQGATSYLLKSSNASGETAFGRTTGLNHIRIGNVEIPTDASGAVFLKFRPYDSAAYIPAWKVLAGQVPRDLIAGKIILIGTSAPGLLDLRATPLDAAVPGVEIHAQLLEDMLTGRLLTRPDYALALEEILILALGTMLAVVLPRVSARASAAVGVLTVVAVFFAGWVAFHNAGLLLDPSYPALALFSMTAAITFYVYRQVEAQRSQIRHAFGRYLAPAVVEEIIADPQRLELGGEERELTLMFTDVRNFTAIAEQLTATELTLFINELLSPLSEIILKHRGTIDKYMGDAVMAFWNAPLDDPDHAANACQAAIEMAERMNALNDRWQLQALETGRPFRRVSIGIGLNAGRCCVGNLGSTYRFDYSALGDEVNVTSRFEGLCKIYGVTAVVGDQVLARAKQFPALELDLVQVKGRRRPARIYTFLALLDADPQKTGLLETAHRQFLTAYRDQRWGEAERLLDTCRALGVAALNPYYALFGSRITALRQKSLAASWDGSFALAEK